MSLSAVLANAVSGLAVAQNALSVTSGNVANVNTEGYTRKLAQQAVLGAHDVLELAHQGH